MPLQTVCTSENILVAWYSKYEVNSIKTAVQARYVIYHFDRTIVPGAIERGMGMGNLLKGEISKRRNLLKWGISKRGIH